MACVGQRTKLTISVVNVQFTRSASVVTHRIISKIIIFRINIVTCNDLYFSDGFISVDYEQIGEASFPFVNVRRQF